MIRRARNILATAGSVAILAGGMALAGAGTASAATLPSCAANVNCNSNAFGAAGYNGADDSHTHYRYVATVTTAATGLINLNGTNPGTGSNAGTSGVTLCNENTGIVAQLSLGYFGSPPAFHLAFLVGRYFTGPGGAPEPCVQDAGLVAIPIFTKGTLLNNIGISVGDELALSITYDGVSHSLTFGAFDVTSKVFRSATVPNLNTSWTEYGIGVASQNTHLTPVIPGLEVAAYSANQVACYSCANTVPITSVSPVNPFNIGGQYESQLVNISFDPIISPLDSLAVSTDTFGISRGGFIS